MGMCVNKAWQYNPTTRVDYFAVARNQSLNRITLSGAFNPTIANKQSSVSDYPQVAQLRTNARAFRTSKRHELFAVDDGERFRHDFSAVWTTGCR